MLWDRYEGYRGPRTNRDNPDDPLVQSARVDKIRGDLRLPLPLRLSLRMHSPNGFEWGYGGSGPAQLALSLCVEVLGSQVVRFPTIYQRFKRQVIAVFPHDCWVMTGLELRAQVAECILGTLQDSYLSCSSHQEIIDHFLRFAATCREL